MATSFSVPSSLKTLSLMMLGVFASQYAYAELITNQPAVQKYPSIPSADNIDPAKVAQCTQLTDNIARLACFDKVALGEIIPTKKEPLDLSKTITASLQERKAVPILAESDASIQQLTDDMLSERDKANILQQVGVTANDVASYSALSVLYDLDQNNPQGLLTIRPHLPMYVMPVWYNATPNYDIHSPTQDHVVQTGDQLQNLDTKMQVSFKTKLAEDVFNTNADVWFGYTQQAYWQLYNRHSRPFRSSDYQPEIFITQPVTAKLPAHGNLRLLGAGVVHESNGQGDPLSRSWNRAYLMAGAEWGKLTVIPRVWAIGKATDNKSDNPDIADYMGYGDVRWLYDLSDNSTVGGVVRYNPFENKGAVQVDYAYPLTGGMKAFIQLFHGYGENIQDYNHKSTNVGVGLMFNDFKGL
ncbi:MULTISPECIES: phospholipase A [unclassified Moraxella]|uniref:phospholipase A n=1 Tax=unclassified Moraxella TaxID=2685852 RepID=UPI003AF6FB22